MSENSKKAARVNSLKKKLQVRRAATGGLRRRHAGLDLVVELLRHLGGVKLRHAENCAGLSYRKARFYGRQRAGRAGRKAPKLFTAR